MPDLMSSAENELQQLMSRVAMKAGAQTVRYSLKVSGKLAALPFKIAGAIFGAISKEIHKGQSQGQVSLKAFTKNADGKRDVVKLDDEKVSKEFAKELRRHGVLWSVENHPDGSKTFHIEGKDAELVQHALGVAANRIDEKIARGAPELQADPETQAPDQEQPSAPEHDEQDPAQEQADQQRDSTPRLVDHGSAPYENRDGGSPSYFVTVEQGGVERTHWGVDLERAIDQSGAQIGDGIAIETVGSTPVTLPDGTEAHRNSWNITVTDAQQPAPTQDAPTQDAPTPAPQQSHGADLAPHGTDELREDAPARATSIDQHDDAPTPQVDDGGIPEPDVPERDEAVSDRGGHSSARETPAPREERPPAPRNQRDRTRLKNADRIDKDVKQKKAQRQNNNRTQTRGRGRDTADAAREATRRGGR